jgi:RNA polymerase sigma-70 factor (ECF subfamily)
MSYQLKESRKQDLREQHNRMTDEELVLACQRQEPGAFDCLLKRHKKTIAGMLHRVAPDWKDTADIAQEADIRIWRSIGQVRNAALFKTWLNKIVTNLFYDELRKLPRKVQFVSLDEPMRIDGGVETAARDIPDPRLQPDDLAVGNELSSLLLQAISKVPEEFRTAVILRDLEGLSYEQIAELTSTELGTVKSRISRARLKIQKRLRRYIKECA